MVVGYWVVVNLSTPTIHRTPIRCNLLFLLVIPSKNSSSNSPSPNSFPKKCPFTIHNRYPFSIHLKSITRHISVYLSLVITRYQVEWYNNNKGWVRKIVKRFVWKTRLIVQGKETILTCWGLTSQKTLRTNLMVERDFISP